MKNRAGLKSESGVVKKDRERKENGKALFFAAALKQARQAFDKNEVPIGAVLVQDGKIIARAHNSTEAMQSHLAHAEILVIQKAAKIFKSKYLRNCDLYITLEPCQMCRAAAKLARIRHIYYAVSSPKFGHRGIAYFKTKIKKLKSAEETESQQLLSLFFSALRMRKSKGLCGNIFSSA